MTVTEFIDERRAEQNPVAVTLGIGFSDYRDDATIFPTRNTAVAMATVLHDFLSADYCVNVDLDAIVETKYETDNQWGVAIDYMTDRYVFVKRKWVVMNIDTENST